MGYDYRLTIIDSIDRQIEELKRRKEAIQNGCCYVHYTTVHYEDEFYNPCGTIRYTSTANEMRNRDGSN